MERERGADAPIEQSTAGGFGSVATSVAKKPILQPADSDDEYPHSMPVDGSVPSSAKESGRMERERGADAPIEQSTAGGSGLAATSVAKQPILQPADSDDEYPHSMPGDGSVPSDLDPEEVTRYVLEELLPMGTPHEYQVEAISSIVFDRQNLVLIRRTGEGKSVVPLAVTAMRRKVTIVLVSLIGLGSDQATKNFLEGERVEAIHLDENKSQLDFDRVNKRIDKMIQDKNNGIMKEGIIMYVSPMKLESNAQWQQMFVKLAQNDLISLFCIDEAHAIVMQARDFRKEFIRAISNMRRIIDISGKRVPVLAMTATLRGKHLDEMTSKLGITDDYKLMTGPMNRRSIAIRVSFAAKPNKSMQDALAKQLDGHPRKKRLVYVTAKNAAEGCIRDNAEKAIARTKSNEGDISVITGDSGLMEKIYDVNQFNSEGGSRVIVGTEACNCGVSSVLCNGAERVGMPRNLLDLSQEHGRGNRTNSDSRNENEYHLHLSIDGFVQLFVQTMSTESKTERKLLLDDLMETLNFLVLPADCYHTTLETKLEELHTTKDPKQPCGDSCSFCNASHGTDPFEKTDLVTVLNVIFHNGPIQLMQLYKELKSSESMSKLFGPQAYKLPMGKIHALILQLIASNIICISVNDKSLIGTNKIDKKNIVCNIGLPSVDGQRIFATEITANWKGFNLKSIR